MARRKNNGGKDYDVMNPSGTSDGSKAAKKQGTKAIGKAIKAVGKAIFKIGKAIVQALIKARALWMDCFSSNYFNFIGSCYYNIF